MDPLLQLLADLGFDIGEASSITDLSDEQLSEAEQLLIEAFDEARAERDVDRCESLADNADLIRQEQANREQAAAQDDARLAELDARIRAQEEGEGEGEPDGDPAEGEAPEPEAEAEEPAPAEPEAIAADAAPVVPPRRMPRPQPSRQRTPTGVRPGELPATITAAAGLADIGGRSIRSRNNMRELGDAAGARVAMALKSQSQVTFPVARATWEYPEARTFGADPWENTRKWEAIVAGLRDLDAHAILAAGGLCAPVSIRYAVDGVSDERRPVRDSLVRFGADRGGVRFNRPPLLADLAGAVDVITEAEDAASATKPCLTVTCGSEIEELVDAITKCLQIGNFHRKFFRENFERFWQLAGAQHAREAEQNLLARMEAATGVCDQVADEVLGARRDILENIRQAAAEFRSRHRTLRDMTLRVILDEWVADLMAADAIRQIPGDDVVRYTRRDAEADLAAANIVVTWSPDWNPFTACVDGAALQRWPGTVEALLFPEGSYAFLDGGMLDFGMEIRDSTLNEANNVRSMSETFEGVALFGPEAIHLTMDVCPSGLAAGTIDPSTDVCAEGS